MVPVPFRMRPKTSQYYTSTASMMSAFTSATALKITVLINAFNYSVNVSTQQQSSIQELVLLSRF
jgi:hypothetical protein